MIIEITADQLWQLAKDGLISEELLTLSEQYVLSIGQPTCNSIKWDGESYYIKICTRVISQVHKRDPAFPHREYHAYAGVNKWIVPHIPPPIELLQVAMNFGSISQDNNA